MAKPTPSSAKEAADSHPFTPSSSLLSLTGKRSVVTGGAQGIGLGICRRLAEAGSNVLIFDAAAEAAKSSAEDLCKQFGDKKVQFFVGDVSKVADVDKAVEHMVASFGGVDIVVNCAGIYPFTPLLQMTEEIYDKVLAINLKGTYFVTQKFANLMVKQGKGGKVINISSIDAVHPEVPGLSAYDSSKHGVHGFTKSAALELASHNISVNAVAPGRTWTESSDPGALKMGITPKKAEELSAGLIPMGRRAVPDDIAKVVLFIASDMSSYMTGEQVIVDGGKLLR